MRYGQSLGSPTDGRLIGGMRVDESSYLRVLPAYANGDVRWGVEPLVSMLDRAARAVRRQFSDATTSVGHLSREGGGEIDRHRSHESGRDADVGFFVRSASGRQVLETNFVPFRADGTAPTWPGAIFDDAKNWALVSAMLEDPEAHVTHIFVASPLRARLLAFAERIGVPDSLRIRAAETMHQPRGSLPHDDHFHVRIACPEHMQGCVENPGVRTPGPTRAVVGRTRRATPLWNAGAGAAARHFAPDAGTVDSVTPVAPESAQPSVEPAPAPLDIRTGVDDVDG
jgi:penicillin-insensitive murein endopeptidase